MFDWFKKKIAKPEYDPLNMSLTNLKKGFVLDYMSKTWLVTKEHEYDWGNNDFTMEYQLTSSNENIYLHVEEDDNLKLLVSKPVNFSTVGENLASYIRENEQPPGHLEFGGRSFSLISETAGHCREMASERWDPFIAWDYEEPSGQYILTLEQWGEGDFEAYLGKIAFEYEFKDILPGE